MNNTLRVLVVISALVISSCAINRPTVTQLIPSPALFMVSHQLRFTIDGNEIDVPVGFVTDLASIPRALWWWQGPQEGTMAPAIIHDYLYWEQPCTKDEADAVLYVAMREVGMKGSALLVYDGVRTPAGRRAWEADRKAREKGEKRFFTKAYAKKLQDGAVTPWVSYVSLEVQAEKQNGMYTPPSPGISVKRACEAALKRYRDMPLCKWWCV